MSAQYVMGCIMTGEHGSGALKCSCGCRIRGLCEVHQTWKKYAGIVRTLPVDLFPPIRAAGVNARNQEAEVQTPEGNPRFLRGPMGLALILSQGKKTRQRI